MCARPHSLPSMKVLIAAGANLSLQLRRHDGVVMPYGVVAHHGAAAIDMNKLAQEKRDLARRARRLAQTQTVDADRARLTQFAAELDEEAEVLERGRLRFRCRPSARTISNSSSKCSSKCSSSNRLGPRLSPVPRRAKIRPAEATPARRVKRRARSAATSLHGRRAPLHSQLPKW